MSVTTPGQLFGNGSYRSQLQSKEWQEFASRMRSEKGYTCEACKQTNRTIQIHHIFYDFDRAITDYSSLEVVALCEPCHKELHDQLKLFRKLVFRHLDPKSFAALNRALMVGVMNNDELEFAYAINELAHDGRLVKNFCRAWIDREPETFIKPGAIMESIQLPKRKREGVRLPHAD